MTAFDFSPEDGTAHRARLRRAFDEMLDVRGFIRDERGETFATIKSTVTVPPTAFAATACVKTTRSMCAKPPPGEMMRSGVPPARAPLAVPLAVARWIWLATSLGRTAPLRRLNPLSE